MILFYSEYCKHCNILLETIKRHDKNNLIKMVSIDVLRSLKKPIDPKIHSVPALLILNTKEYLFGKAVFDHLLLPNRGVLFSGTLTRDDKKSSKSNTSVNSVIDTKQEIDEPGAFSLGTITSENYAHIDEDNQMRNDTNYQWDLIDNNDVKSGATNDTKFKDDSSSKKLPTMEEIMKQRAQDVK